MLEVQAVARQLSAAAAAATTPGTVKALLLALRGLAADRVWNVRRAAAEALPGVARAGMPGGVETALEVLGSLMADASSWVRSAALLAASGVFTYAPAGSLTPGAHPNFCSLTEAAKSNLTFGKNLSVIQSVSVHLGPAAYSSY
jgi:hypothetical protein